MIGISYVAQERDDKGNLTRHYDPRRGLSDYTVYMLYTGTELSSSDKEVVGSYITKLLKEADYGADAVKAKILRAPIACYPHNATCIKLILFSSYDASVVARALASGRKNLGC